MDLEFKGWPKATYTWLAKLEKNNNKPWFTENRATYDEIRAASQNFVELLADRMGSEGEAKVWRIHRDQRFSKGEPYKTTHDMGVMSSNGWMDGLRIEATGVTVATGAFAWNKEQLVRYREAVVDSEVARQLQTALDEAADVGFTPDEPELKRPLKDLPEDHPNPDLTRRKGLFLSKTHPKRPKWLSESDALEKVTADLKSVQLMRQWCSDNVF